MDSSTWALPGLGALSWRIEGPIPVLDWPCALSEALPLLLVIDRCEGVAAGAEGKLLSCLDACETARYSLYWRASDAQLFLPGHGLLRTLLSVCLGLSPVVVPILTGFHGTPFCPVGPEFNVSHAGDLVLIAARPALAVGVDVERSLAPPDWQAIASRVLPSCVCLATDALPRQRQESVFLQAWCHLEAHLKMVGTGLRSPAIAHADSTAYRRWTLPLPRAYFGSVAMAWS